MHVGQKVAVIIRRYSGRTESRLVKAIINFYNYILPRSQHRAFWRSFGEKYMRLSHFINTPDKFEGILIILR